MQEDSIFKNAYSFVNCEEQVTICIENISDDIGGFIRAFTYTKKTDRRATFLLVLLIRDDFQLADGNYIMEPMEIPKKNNVNNVIFLPYAAFKLSGN